MENKENKQEEVIKDIPNVKESEIVPHPVKLPIEGEVFKDNDKEKEGAINKLTDKLKEMQENKEDKVEGTKEETKPTLLDEITSERKKLSKTMQYINQLGQGIYTGLENPIATAHVSSAIVCFELGRGWYGKAQGELGKEYPYTKDGSAPLADFLPLTEGQEDRFEDKKLQEKITYLRDQVGDAINQAHYISSVAKNESQPQAVMRYLALVVTEFEKARMSLGFLFVHKDKFQELGL